MWLTVLGYALLAGVLYAEFRVLIRVLNDYLLPYLSGTSDKYALQRVKDLLLEDLVVYSEKLASSGYRFTDEDWDKVSQIDEARLLIKEKLDE